MELEKLEKAKELQSQIEFLKEKIKIFDKKHKWCYLHTSDHYGNKSVIIETYAFSETYQKAAGYGFDNYIANAYGEFLEKVCIKMQERIDFLQAELNNL